MKSTPGGADGWCDDIGRSREIEVDVGEGRCMGDQKGFRKVFIRTQNRKQAMASYGQETISWSSALVTKLEVSRGAVVLVKRFTSARLFLPLNVCHCQY